jgi:hypothetical protein
MGGQGRWAVSLSESAGIGPVWTWRLLSETGIDRGVLLADVTIRHRPAAVRHRPAAIGVRSYALAQLAYAPREKGNTRCELSTWKSREHWR